MAHEVVFFLKIVQIPYVLVENSGRCNTNSGGEKVREFCMSSLLLVPANHLSVTGGDFSYGR
jgi:hypothetical protein